MARKSRKRTSRRRGSRAKRKALSRRRTSRRRTSRRRKNIKYSLTADYSLGHWLRGDTLLIQAARSGSVDKVAELLDDPTTEIDNTNDFGKTALLEATFRGSTSTGRYEPNITWTHKYDIYKFYIPIIRMLLEYGANPNISANPKRLTPIMIVVSNIPGGLELVSQSASPIEKYIYIIFRLLLDNSFTNLFLKNNQGQTVLDIAKRKNNPLIIRELEEKIHRNIGNIVLPHFLRPRIQPSRDGGSIGGSAGSSFMPNTRYVSGLPPEIVSMISEEYDKM